MGPGMSRLNTRELLFRVGVHVVGKCVAKIPSEILPVDRLRIGYGSSVRRVDRRGRKSGPADAQILSGENAVAQHFAQPDVADVIWVADSGRH